MLAKFKGARHVQAIEFLPDADEMERSPLPPMARVTVHVLAAALLSFGIWATVSKVDKVVVAHGRLVNPAPNIVLQPLETAVIQKITVKVGQVVKKGDPLATLDPTFVQADEAQLRSRMETLETQAAGIQLALDGPGPEPEPTSSQARGQWQGQTAADADSKIQSSLFAERRGNFLAQLNKLKENLARSQAVLQTNQRDQQVLGARLRATREIEAMQEKLMAAKFGARINLLEAGDRRLAIEREMLLTRNRESEIKSEVAGLEADIEAFGKGWRQKLTEDLLATTRELGAVNEQLTKANLRRKLVNMVAPVDAVVLDIAKLSVGSVIREAEPFFTLVALGGQMEAEVQIDSLDVGYIKAGDVAHLKLDAFPFQKHGTLEAKVRAISVDAFRRDAATGGGLDAFYVSRIAFGTAHLRKMPDHTSLLPGMTLSAEVVVGKRSVISYLIWPLTKALDEAIKEP
jgi:hemolysin D